MARINLEAEKAEEMLKLIEMAKENGKLKKGTNEVTKAAERATAKIIVVANDVNPAELVMHIPLICDEKSIKCVSAGNREELGTAAGLAVGTTAVAIVDAGNAKDELQKFIDSL